MNIRTSVLDDTLVLEVYLSLLDHTFYVYHTRLHIATAHATKLQLFN